MTRKKKDATSFNLRLPRKLLERIGQATEHSMRSLNSEMVWRLEQTFSERWERFVRDEETTIEQITNMVVNEPRMMEVIKRVAKEQYERR